jgi:hypothetical protein
MLTRVIALALLTCGALFGQAYTTITANQIKDNNGNPLASGNLCFVATDSANSNITYTPSGGSPISSGTPVCGTVTAGVLASGFQIANIATASPAGLNYRVFTSDGISTVYVIVPLVTAVTGASFNWDAYAAQSLNSGSFKVTGDGVPRIACNAGAQYDQTDVTAHWLCVNIAGQGSWGLNGIIPNQGSVGLFGAQAVLGFYPGLFGAFDTGISRQSAGVLALGNGTWGDTSATVKAAHFVGDGSELTNVASTVMSIKSLGATCNGASDDTTALTTLATMANVTVVFPSGGACGLSANITIPSTVQIQVQSGGGIDVASGFTLTESGPIDAGQYQIFFGSGTVSVTFQRDVYAYWFPGSGLGAQVTAAVADLGVGCGHIRLPRTSTNFSTTWNLDNSVGCDVDGGGSITGGSATNNVYLIYTGTSNIISARSATGLKLHGFSIVANNGSFNAKGIDLTHSSAATDTFKAKISDIALVTTAGAKYSIAVDFNLAIDSSIEDSLLAGYVIGVNGTSSASPGYSNANGIKQVDFESSSVSTYSILNPGEGWSIDNDTFENGGNTTLSPIGCNLTGGNEFKAAGVVITAGWFGDWANNSNATQVQVCGPGWNVAGNFMAGPGGTPTFNEFSITAGVAGFSATANDFDIVSTGTNNIVNLGSPNANIVLMANKMESAPTNFLVGTCTNGYITDYNGAQLCPYPSGPLSGSFNATTAPTLPAQVGGSGAFFTGGYASPTVGALYIGDGSGYHFVFRKRVSSTDTDLGYIQDNGTLHFSGYFSGASAGVSCTGTPTSLFTSLNGIVTHC